MDVVEVLMYLLCVFMGGFIVTVLLHELRDPDNVLNEVLADGGGHVSRFKRHTASLSETLFFLLGVIGKDMLVKLNRIMKLFC